MIEKRFYNRVFRKFSIPVTAKVLVTSPRVGIAFQR